MIYKLLLPSEWAALQSNGTSSGAPIDLADGYVHFSTAAQVGETAAKYFAGIDGLMLLALPSEPLGTALKWEASRGGDLFPHLYGPLRMADVAWAKELEQADGAHIFPDLT